jgi:flagellar export protein FliJ
MKRFQFNLKQLLKLRKYDERNWEIKLGQIVSKCNLMEHRIADLNSTRVKAFLEYHLPGSGIEMLKISEQYLQKLNYEISQSKLKLQGYLSEKTKIQKIFIEVSNKRKVLDKLKEKEEQGYYKEQALAELKEIDDISIGIALRKRNKKAQSA